MKLKLVWWALRWAIATKWATRKKREKPEKDKR